MKTLKQTLNEAILNENATESDFKQLLNKLTTLYAKAVEVDNKARNNDVMLPRFDGIYHYYNKVINTINNAINSKNYDDFSNIESGCNGTIGELNNTINAESYISKLGKTLPVLKSQIRDILENIDGDRKRDIGISAALETGYYESAELLLYTTISRLKPTKKIMTAVNDSLNDIQDSLAIKNIRRITVSKSGRYLDEMLIRIYINNIMK